MSESNEMRDGRFCHHNQFGDFDGHTGANFPAPNPRPDPKLYW